MRVRGKTHHQLQSETPLSTVHSVDGFADLPADPPQVPTVWWLEPHVVKSTPSVTQPETKPTQRWVLLPSLPQPFSGPSSLSMHTL